jgi:hypothetical protein
VAGNDSFAGPTPISKGHATPPPERFPLAYYGYAKRHSDGTHALFCDDDTIYLVREGDVIGGRFRVLRIGATSAEVEDLARHKRETLVMEPDAVTS